MVRSRKRRQEIRRRGTVALVVVLGVGALIAGLVGGSGNQGAGAARVGRRRLVMYRSSAARRSKARSRRTAYSEW
jgi:hypothetical protein